MIHTQSLEGVAKQKLDEQLEDIEKEGGQVISVSVLRTWEGWYLKRRAVKMDVVITYRT